MTKTSNECLESMNDEEFANWYRGTLIRLLQEIYKQGKILEYRYLLISMDLMDAKTEGELLICSDQIRFGLSEKQCSVLYDRMNRGLEIMREEKDELRKAKLRTHYENLKKEAIEVMDSCPIQSKY